jgi:hypothetical protein
MYLSLYASARRRPTSSFPQWIVGRFWSNMRRPWKAKETFDDINIMFGTGWVEVCK